MTKNYFLLAIFVLFALTSCKEAWQCDTANTFSCTSSQTCCRSSEFKTGWACFNTSNGNCCSNGINACPSGYICNLNEKRCDPVQK